MSAVTWMRALLLIGGVLQLVGVGMVFGQLAAVERLLHLRSWFTSWITAATSPILGAFGWLALSLRIRKKRIVPLSGVGRATSTGHAALNVSLTRAPGRTTRERLDSHQLQLDDLRRDVQGVRDALVGQSAEQAARIQALEARVDAEVVTLNALIRNVIGGGRGLQALGAILILIGILFATAGSLLPTC
jgi:hypothetical protein